jgi:tetratricopeptide (TPR) repeat protein
MQKKFIVFWLMFLLYLGGYNRLYAVFVWLADGTILHGKIIEHAEKKIVFQRFDNGGVIEIPWTAMHPRCRKELRKKLGLSEKKGVVYKIPGVKVYLKTGGATLGKLISEGKDQIVIKNKTGEITIAHTNILTTEKTAVSIAQVFKSEEIYEHFRSSFSLKNAEGNLKFGEFLLNLGDHSNAKLHLEKAKELQPTLENRVQTLLESIAKASEELAHKKTLQLYHSYKNSHRYGKAMEILKKLQLPPEQLQKYEKELKDDQMAYLCKEVAYQWIQLAQRKISTVSSNRKWSLKEAQDYVLNAMEQEMIETISKELQIAEEEVRNYLEKRGKSSLYRYGYRDGTFIVGTIGRLPEGKSSKPHTSRKQFAGGVKLQSPEEWWEIASSSRRQEWLQAYYFENRFTIVEQELRPCQQCAGKGIEVRGNETTLCRVCHGFQYERTVVVK